MISLVILFICIILILVVCLGCALWKDEFGLWVDQSIMDCNLVTAGVALMVNDQARLYEIVQFRSNQPI